MTRHTLLLLSFVSMAAVASAQQPQVQNGRVEARQAMSIDREVSSFSASADPVWIGWRVPIVDGENGGCSTWNSDEYFYRGYTLDFGMFGTSTSYGPPRTTPQTGPAQIEASSNLVMLARVTDGRVDRLSRFSGDCPIDAGGRSLYWLNGITPAESLRWLDGFIGLDKGDRLSLSARQTLASTALSAIAMHRDAGADAILDRVAMNDRDTTLRQRAESSLGRYRGAHGFASLRALLAQERAPERKRQLITSLGQTREAGTVDALRGFLKDQEPKVRAEAVYYFAIRGGQAVAPEVRSLMDSDPVLEVRTRAVSGLARMPEAAAVPLLIDVATKSTDLEVRKRAISSLGQSKDPRAVSFLQDLVRK
jgi:hypothetical protein